MNIQIKLKHCTICTRYNRFIQYSYVCRIMETIKTGSLEIIILSFLVFSLFSSDGIS